MSDYAFFTGVTGMHWAVLTSPSKGGSQVSLDDDETVAVSGNYDASVSYSYQDPVTGGPARLMTGSAPTTPPSPSPSPRRPSPGSASYDAGPGRLNSVRPL